MSEGGEARNHETEAVEVVIAKFFTAWMTREDRHFVRDEIMAALDAVRCAQGRDTDAPEGLAEAVDEFFRKVDVNGGIPVCPATIFAKAAARLRESARSPQVENHDADALLARSLRAHHGIVPAPQGEDHEAEVDRLRAGISFVRGLCTDRASYSVIDERLGELLDGETT